MIPAHRTNEAYDNLNLPRDAGMQAVIDRVAALRERYNSDTDKLEQVNEAYRTLELADSYAQSQRNAVTSRTRTRSERELDGKLTEMAMRAGQGQTRRIPAATESEAKKHKIEEPEVKSETPQGGDDKVFEKLNSLLRDESKYHRAVSVLFNIAKSAIEKQQLDATTVRMLSTSVDTATVVCSAAGKPLANLNEDNRKATTRVINLILATDELRATIDSDLIRSWSHAVIFRNSLFELDNFNFVKRCKELVSLVGDAKAHCPPSEETERWLDGLLLSIETLSSRDVCKIIPGRTNDAKSSMTEIYKLSRDPAFPLSFRDKIADLQKQFMSSIA